MLQQLPNIAQSFQNWKLILELEKVLTDNSLIGYSILLAIKNNTPYKLILSNIASQAKDNLSAFADILGVDLLTDILNSQNGT